MLQGADAALIVTAGRDSPGTAPQHDVSIT